MSFSPLFPVLTSLAFEWIIADFGCSTGMLFENMWIGGMVILILDARCL